LAVAESTGLGNIDLQIGVASLHFGFAVGTDNVRHFTMIPI
jgi:predicted nucleic acid-binding protein